MVKAFNIIYSLLEILSVLVFAVILSSILDILLVPYSKNRSIISVHHGSSNTDVITNAIGKNRGNEDIINSFQGNLIAVISYGDCLGSAYFEGFRSDSVVVNYGESLPDGTILSCVYNNSVDLRKSGASWKLEVNSYPRGMIFIKK